jgi:hypothetical protein
MLSNTHRLFADKDESNCSLLSFLHEDSVELIIVKNNKMPDPNFFIFNPYVCIIPDKD